MTQEDIKISIEVQCPYCNSNELDLSHAEQIRLTGDGLEVEQYSVLWNDTFDRLETEDIFDWDNFLCGLCESCGKTFAIRLFCPDEGNFRSPTVQQREAQFLCQWRDLTFGLDGEILLSPSGIPMAMLLGNDMLKFVQVNPTWSPHQEQVGDALYYAPPYGTYEIVTMDGRMELWITHKLTWCGAELREDKTGCVGRIRKLDGYLERHLHRHKVTDDVKDIPVRFPVERILQAAFHTVFHTETLIRNKVWTVLGEKYGGGGGKWYKGVLGPELTQKLFARAKKSGDKHLSRSRLQEYLTLGECAELINGRWEKDFAETFERAAYILRDIKVMEDYRNSIAHFRHMDFESYDDLVLTCTRLRKTFE